MITLDRFNIGPCPAIFFFEFIHCLFTSVAHEERFPLFYSQNRDEKKIKIMIHPFIIGLDQTAHRTSLWMVVKNSGFGRNTGNQEHGGFSGSILALKVMLF